MDFEVGKIIKNYKDQKAKLYYRTQYRKNSNTDKKDKDSKITSNEESCEENISNKVIFNTLVKKKINDPSNILEELTLDSNNDFLTYKIEFEQEQQKDINLSFNYSNNSIKSIISGVESRISTVECCKNLLEDTAKEQPLETNLNLSTDYARENTENNYAKNTETNMKTETTIESEKFKDKYKYKINFTMGKYSSRLTCFEKKKPILCCSTGFSTGLNGIEIKHNTTNIKLNNDKISNKIIYNKFYTSNDKNKISFIPQQQITFKPQLPIQEIKKLNTIEKKSSSNVVANVPKEESNFDCKSSPNYKAGKVIVPNLNFSCLTGSKHGSITTRLQSLTKSQINSNRNSNDQSNIQVNNQFNNPFSKAKNSSSNRNISFISTNKSVDFKKAINNNSKLINNNLGSTITSTKIIRHTSNLEKNILDFDNTFNEIEVDNTDKEVNKILNPFHTGIYLLNYV